MVLKVSRGPPKGLHGNFHVRHLHKLTLNLEGEPGALVIHSRDFYYSDSHWSCNAQTFEALPSWWPDIMSHNFQKSLSGSDQMNYVSSLPHWMSEVVLSSPSSGLGAAGKVE